jgi:hypothetical protein
MRNSSSGKSNTGYSTEIYDRNQSHDGLSRRSPSHGSGSKPILRQADVIDVEFEHVDELRRPAWPRVSKPVDQGAPLDHAPTPDRIEFKDGHSAANRRLNVFSGESQEPRGGWTFPTAGFAAAVIIVSLCGFWFAGGHVITAMMSQGASDLTLSDVASRNVAGTDGNVVMVRGKISNETQSVLEVPLIAIETGGQSESEPPLYVRAPKKQLAAGESTRFRVRVMQPVRGHKDLTISLAGGSGGR